MRLTTKKSEGSVYLKFHRRIIEIKAIIQLVLTFDNTNRPKGSFNPS